MAPFFANNSCNPFLPPSAQCVVGTYVSYAVDVHEPRDIAETVKFAQRKNIRLIIRNTGHDYNGKSTGAGALAVWTHHLKDIKVMDYQSEHYVGKAMKMGAGVQGFEAYNAAHEQRLTVVGGECPTVGLAGGYSQGGGHSALASKYGLAADQVLEWEVVDGRGNYMVANRKENSDLYWALAGGGGGTYGVVTSMTSKAHEDIPTSGANLTFTSDGLTQETFYGLVSTFVQSLPPMVDAGAMALWFVTNRSFALTPVTAPGVTTEALSDFLRPLTERLDALNVKYNLVVQQFPGFLEQYHAMQVPVPVGTSQYGGRLIPRDVVARRGDDFVRAIRDGNNDGAPYTGVALNVSKARAGDVDNAVLPAWRDTLVDSVLVTPWNFTAPLSDMLASQRKMTDRLLPRLEELTPGGGCYLNEGDFRQPNFQEVFYGANYRRLSSIKDKYDPDHMFYGLTAVGSEYWVPEADGRLCKASIE